MEQTSPAVQTYEQQLSARQLTPTELIDIVQRCTLRSFSRQLINTSLTVPEASLLITSI